MSSCQNILRFYFNTPNEEEMRAEAENVIEKGKKAPRKEPGDRYPIGGALIGIAAGFITGVAIGGWTAVFMQVIGAVCGGIIGALIGSLIRFLIEKFHRTKNNLPHY
jgi:hypothetical protein